MKFQTKKGIGVRAAKPPYPFTFMIRFSSLKPMTRANVYGELLWIENHTFGLWHYTDGLSYKVRKESLL